MIKNKIIGIDARMIEMSGIGTYIQHLMGQKIYDYALGVESEIRKYDNDVKIIHFTAPIYGIKEQLKFPKKEIHKAGIDIIHFPHYNVPIFYKGDYVVTIHDLTHIILPNFLGNRIKYYYARTLMKNAIKRAKHIFTVSKNSKKDIIKYFGTDNNKISITYNAIDKEFCVKKKEEINYLYEKFEIPINKKVILYVGNLKPHKNLVRLLKAFAKLNHNDVVLLLVGKAFKSIQLNEQEKKLGIKEFVIHTGMVDKNELIGLYNLADIFVFPSLYEGFGIPPLEAMACGTPVVAANNSSIPEVVGNAAILFDATKSEAIKKSIEFVLSNDRVRKKLIENGFQRIIKFSWDDTIAKTLKSIKKCVE